MTSGDAQPPRAARGVAGRVAVAAILIGLGAAVGWAASGVDRGTPDPISEPAGVTPVVVEVEPSERAIATSAAVVVRSRPSPVIVSPRDGVLTTIEVVAGAEIVNGSRLFTVNDVPVVAMTSSAPLYRSLVRGDRGPDVVRLQQWLDSLGHRVEADGNYGGSTARAVSDFRRSRELPGDGGDRFDLAWVAWTGPSPFTAAQLAVGLGTVVGVGTPVAEAGTVVTGIDVTELAPYPADVDSILEVGSASVPYRSGSGRIDAGADASTVAAALDGETEGTAMVRGVTGEKVIVLPAGAVVTDATGATCVFPFAEAKPVDVSVIGSGIGTQSISPIDGLRSVLSNPTVVIRSPSCG